MARLIFFGLIFAVLSPLGWVAGLWVAVGLLWLFTAWVSRGDDEQRERDRQDAQAAYDRSKAGR
jgi:hypothetical protein